MGRLCWRVQTLPNADLSDPLHRRLNQTLQTVSETQRQQQCFRIETVRRPGMPGTKPLRTPGEGVPAIATSIVGPGYVELVVGVIGEIETLNAHT